MAVDSRRDRSTSSAIRPADADNSQRNKRSRSRSASHDEPEASTSKGFKLQARGPSQTTKSKGNKNNITQRENEEQADESIPVASASTSKPSSTAKQTSRRPAERPLRRISGAQDKSVLQELADVQTRLEDSQANYQALREAYQTLQDLRESGPEGTLREVQEQVVGRLEALRKQVSTYAKENEELRSQADALKEEIATLSERQNTSESAVDNRRKNRNNVEDIDMDNSLQHDRTEEAEKNFKDDTASSSRQDEAVLRKENESLNEQILELRDELSALKDEALQLKKERKTFKKQWEADLERLESRLKQRWEKERKRLIAEKEDLAARSEQLEKELAFEVEQSKKLQSLASQNTASQSKTAATVPAVATITTSRGGDSEELIQLLLDFTGMTLVRRPQEGDKTYNFVMTDFKKRKALNFKLIVDREAGSVDFIPDLLPGRDDEVIDSMEHAIRGHIKFEYELIQTFFKRLWRALNGHK